MLDGWLGDRRPSPTGRRVRWRAGGVSRERRSTAADWFQVSLRDEVVLVVVNPATSPSRSGATERPNIAGACPGAYHHAAGT